jgi:carboxymethylenebutenolidase
VGAVDAIRDACERLAREGFVALAPDLFDGARPAGLDEARRAVAGLDAARLRTVLAAGVDALLGRDEVDGPRVGAVGFCMGGHLALLAAAVSPRVAAAVDFYGLPWLAFDPAPIRASVLGIFAERDEIVPSDEVDALRARLEAAHVRARFHVQPGVGHAFMNASRPDRYDASAADEGWSRMLAFLRAELA